VDARDFFGLRTGGLWPEDGRWKMEDGVEAFGREMEGGRWKVEDIVPAVKYLAVMTHSAKGLM